jgi:hypothetical protein
LKSFAPAEFWRHYEALPGEVQRLADRNFERFEHDPFHPSLHFKEVLPGIWSARVGIHHRALCKRRDDGWMWFWIGSHADYDKLLKRR